MRLPGKDEIFAIPLGLWAAGSYSICMEMSLPFFFLSAWKTKGRERGMKIEGRWAN